MAYDLYVGNFPLQFRRKDVAEIFRDYDGIEVLKFFRNEKKCYSFLRCKDINQLVLVIREKNNAFISGRKLIVRASDTKLQEYVEFLLRETSDQTEISLKSDRAQQETESQDAYSEGFPVEKSNAESPKFVPVQVLRNKISKHQNTHVQDEQYDKNSCHSPCTSVSSHHFDEHCGSDKYELQTAPSKNRYGKVSKHHNTHVVQDSDEQYDKKSCHSPYSPVSYQHFDEHCSSDKYELQTASSKNSYCKVSKHQNTHVIQDSDEQYDKNLCHSPCSPVSYQHFDEYCSGNKYEWETASSKSSYCKASKHQNTHVLQDLDEQYDKNSCHSPCPSVGYQHFDEHCSGNKYERETASSKSSFYSNSFQCQDDISELTWVSVTNFPLGTRKRSLYKLFSDYNPVDVQMICNEARRDKTITEAYVCFLNREIADDVILNFDNTMFYGRILLVNDTQDLTVMNELLNVLRL